MRCMQSLLSLKEIVRSLLPDDKVHIYTGINSKVCDFLDDAGWAMDVNDSLVNTHLVSVPSLGTLSARTFTGCDSKNLCGNANWALGLVALVLGSCDDLRTCSLK